jgi:hypothetical protein
MNLFKVLKKFFKRFAVGSPRISSKDLFRKLLVNLVKNALQRCKSASKRSCVKYQVNLWNLETTTLALRTWLFLRTFEEGEANLKYVTTKILTVRDLESDPFALLRDSRS